MVNIVALKDLELDDAILSSVLASTSKKLLEDVRPEPEDRSVEWNIPGFGAKVRIGTTFGDLPIEALRVRDTIRTFAGGIARVQWIDKVHLDEDFVSKYSSARPIRIAANAFGQGRPMHEMIVSPRQPLCPEAHVASRFVLARELSSRFDAHVLPSAGLTYYRFHCGEPVVVQAEGVWVKVQP